jgi:hypothetical protein
MGHIIKLDEYKEYYNDCVCWSVLSSMGLRTIDRDFSLLNIHAKQLTDKFYCSENHIETKFHSRD